MKRVFIIHRWDGSPNVDWYQSTANSLKEKGFEVTIPQMPSTAEPEIKSWVYKLSKLVGKPDKDTYFIGHSIGCQAIMRYLESLPQKAKVGGCVFVAGWFNLDNLENEEVKSIAKPWIGTPINLHNVKKHLGNLTVILSSNDNYGFVQENSRIFKEKLKAKVIIEKNQGHFTEDDGITQMPIIIDELLRMVN